MRNKERQIQESHFKVELGNRIVQLRKDKGMLQKDLAFECEWDESFLRTIEKGRANPTLTSLITISRALEIELTDLFKGLKVPK